MSTKSIPMAEQLQCKAIPSMRRAPVVRRLGAGPFARVALWCLTVGMVLLVLFDWLYDFEIVAVPVSLYIRATLLAVFGVYLVGTGPAFARYGFRFGNGLFFFLVVNLIYAVLSDDILGNLYHTGRIAFWVVGTVVAYRLARSGALSNKLLYRSIGATVLLGAAFTIYFMADAEAGQNASAYLLLWCLPLLLMTKKARFTNSLLGIAVVAILLTVKRGAMVGLALSALAYGLAYLKLHGNARAFVRIVGSCIVFAVVSIFTLSQNWEAVESRFADISGSGRDEMYAGLWEHWIHAEPMNVVFGFGLNSVQKYTPVMFGSKQEIGPYAHSDWIQLMHDFGFLGIGFLTWLHVQFLLLIRKSYRRRYEHIPSLVMGYVVLFLVNIYSGHLGAPTAMYCGLLLAFSTASVDCSRSDSLRRAGTFKAMRTKTNR